MGVGGSKDHGEMESLPAGGSAFPVAPAGGTQGGGRRRTRGHKKSHKGRRKSKRSTSRRSKSRRHQ